MGAEIGATCSIFPYDKRMDTYLRATRRGLIADLANQHRDLLVQDPEIEEVAVENRDENIIKYFDRLIEIDLQRLSLISLFLIHQTSQDQFQRWQQMSRAITT